MHGCEEIMVNFSLHGDVFLVFEEIIVFKRVRRSRKCVLTEGRPQTCSCFVGSVKTTGLQWCVAFL